MDDTEDEVVTAAGRFRVRLEYDDSAESPRDWDNLGFIEVTGTRDWNVSEADDQRGHIAEFIERSNTLKDDAPISVRALCRALRVIYGWHTVLPLYSSTDGLSAGDPDSTDLYDNEVVGVMFTRPDDVAPELALNPEFDVAACLRAELDVFNKWARGEFVTMFVERYLPACEHGHGEEWVIVDAVGGFDDDEYAMSQGREFVADYEVTRFDQECRGCGHVIAWQAERPIHYVDSAGVEHNLSVPAHWSSRHDGEHKCAGTESGDDPHVPASWSDDEDDDESEADQ